MPSELPGQMTIPLRDELVARFKQSWLSRCTDGAIEDPQLEVDAATTADMMLPGYANQRVIGSNCVLEDATGDALTQWGIREGVGPKLEANGASGYVIVDASGGGTDITNGDELLDDATGLKFHAVIDGGGSQHFADGDYLPIQATSVGPQTNVVGGRSLSWSVSNPGSGPAAIVATRSDGTGLIGGRDTETEAEYRERIRSEKADRSRSGNDADYRRTVSETPGIRVQQVFTWPAINGTGTTAAAATLAPMQPGGSRVPTEAQRGLIEAYVVGLMPADDGAFYAVMAEQNVDIVYRVAWAREAAGWADVNPWPRYYGPAGTPGAVIVSSATDATHFVLRTQNNVYTNIRQPVAGQTIAFYNQIGNPTTGGEFARKRILSFTGTGPWTIVVDTTNNSSDTTYVPIANQRAMPWSKSLPALLPGIKTYFDGLGPGEMVASFYDAGRRQRRQPEPPREWPHTLTTKGLEEAIDVGELLDRIAIEGPGLTTNLGNSGVLAYLMRLRWIAVLPL